MLMRWEVIGRLLKNPTSGAELGVFKGKFSEPMLEAHRNLTLYAVDTWMTRPPSDRIGFESWEGRDFREIRKVFDKCTKRFGDRVVVLEMDTIAAAEKIPDASLDFVFIDADHTYEAVGADIDACRSKVKPGGILSGHDYTHPRFPGVKRAVDERFAVKTGDDHVWWIRC